MGFIKLNEGDKVEESSSDEDDFDAMEVEPMLTHINKRARFE